MSGHSSPEPTFFEYAYFAAVSLSICSCFIFACVIIYNRLLKTALMKQVLYLCLSDMMVYFWELSWCPSLLNMYPLCLNTMTCNLFYPVLRTLQTASVLWVTYIAVGVALVVSGKKAARCRGLAFTVPIAAVLLNLVGWIAGFSDGYRSAVVNGSFLVCKSTWRIHPDSIWSLEIMILLLVIVVAYVYTVWRIWRLSTAAAVSAKLYRVLVYVAVFAVCYAPYVVAQGTMSRDELAHKASSCLGYQIVYLLYLLAGVCNVGAYGIHHWDGSCWRRSHDRHGSTGNEARVVTFLPNGRSLTSAGGSTAGRSHLSSALSSDECQMAYSDSTRAPDDGAIQSVSDNTADEALISSNSASSLLIMNEAEAYGCV